MKKAGEHGIAMFIDPHQDCWSRFSGGDGAPGWTLQAVGFDLHNLHASGAAILHQMYGDPFPRMKVMEDTLLNFTIWNYTADNTNARGDGWNDEDLSIFSRDQQTDPGDIHSGGRALEAVVRPYALATAGTPGRISFDIRRRRFEYEFRHDPKVSAPTMIFIPNLQYQQGYQVEISDGSYEVDAAAQTLTYRHSPEKEIHKITITGN